MSPRWALRSTEKPLPRRRNCSPVWVPGGIFMRARVPSMTGTSTSAPSAACVMRSGTRQNTVAPSRWKIACGRMATCTYRSPAGAPSAAGLALAGQPDARAVLDARRDLHLQRALALHRAGARADAAGVADHAPLAAAGRARAFDDEEALLRTDLARPRQVGQASLPDRSPFSEPVPLHASQVTRVGTRNVALAPAKASVRSISTAARISAPPRAPRAAAAAPAADEIAEHLLENIADAAAGEVEPAGATAAALLEGRMAEAVIGSALLVVLQHVIGFVHFLELRLGLLVSRIAVRVVLHRQFAIRLLQVFVACLTANSQRDVIVLFRHLTSALNAALVRGCARLH